MKELKLRISAHRNRLFGNRKVRSINLNKLVNLYKEFDYRAKDASLIARDVFDKRLGQGIL